MSKHKTLRLDDSLLARIEAIAKEYRMEFSSAMRFTLKRGVAAVEAENRSDESPPLRRRVLSKGVA